MAFWDNDEWSYDDESGYHHNHDEDWRFFDGDYGPESDWSDIDSSDSDSGDCSDYD
jgi:hypothetical protein